MSSQSRREFRTGRRRALTRASSRERIVLIVGLVLLAVALVVSIERRNHTAQAPAPPPVQEARIVTVPVPMPVERPVPVEPPPPAPIPHRAPVQVRPAPVAVAQPDPTPVEARGPVSASELAALYRSVGKTLEQLDRAHADALWQRYRWIRLADYLMTPEKRTEAAQMLDAIASDARRQ